MTILDAGEWKRTLQQTVGRDIDMADSRQAARNKLKAHDAALRAERDALRDALAKVSMWFDVMLAYAGDWAPDEEAALRRDVERARALLGKTP